MNPQLKLSILISNYNHSKFLPACLDSILEQSVLPFEVLLCDDASSDNSVEVIKEYVKKSPVIKLYVNEQNKGPLFTINKLVELCQGDFLYALGADDKILPGFIEKSMSMLELDPDAGLCSAFTKFIDEGGNDAGFPNNILVSRKARFFSPLDVRKKFLKLGESWILGTSTIYNRKGLVKTGGFLPELGSYCDGFATQVLALSSGACFIPEILTCWRRMPGGYDAQQAGDPKKVLGIINLTIKLMTSEYPDLFDLKYIRTLKNKTYYFANIISWKKILIKQKHVISQEYPGMLERVTTTDRLLFSIMSGISYLQFFLIRIYFSLKYLNVFKEIYFKTKNNILVKYHLKHQK